MIDYRLSYIIGASKENILLDQAAEMTNMEEAELLLAIDKLNEVASNLYGSDFNNK